MKYVGIIAEYNPFHSGHQHHIHETRKLFPDQECTIVVVMSGHWVQQGHCAIADKWTRGRFALEGGADLILDFPTPWATASAQRFAQGAVALLESTGLVTHLSFGSETGELAQLQRIQTGLLHPAFSTSLKQELKEGCSFPVARQRALEKLLQEDCSLLARPNNTLGLEYLMALKEKSSTIQALTIPRKGAGFHSQGEIVKPVHTSATDLRGKIREGNWDYTQDYVSTNAQTCLKAREYPHFSHCERVFLSKMATMTAEDWSLLPDSGAEEGLPYRLEKCGRSALSIQEFLESAKTKRYTHARLRRLLLWAFLGMKPQDFPQDPAYLRIIGMSKRGQAMLKLMKSRSSLPIITKATQVQHQSTSCQTLFLQEVTYTDLYGLCFPTILNRGEEWRQSPVIKLE